MKPLVLVTPNTGIIPDIKEADYAAVDAGLLKLISDGRNPVFACGDFDSLPPETLHKFLPESCRVLEFPAEKNESDSELAIREGKRLGYGPVILTGAFSGRIDHALANIRLLGFTWPDLILTDDGQRMQVLEPGVHEVPGDFDHISLFALEPSCISLEDMKYPLDHRNVTPADIFTLSNEVAPGSRKGIITVHEGRMLLVESDLP